jgi:hypothetical protein
MWIWPLVGLGVPIGRETHYFSKQWQASKRRRFFSFLLVGLREGGRGLEWEGGDDGRIWMVRVGLKGEGGGRDRRWNIWVAVRGMVAMTKFTRDTLRYYILFTVASRPKIQQNNSKPAEKRKQVTGKIGGRRTAADFGPVFRIRMYFMRIQIQLFRWMRIRIQLSWTYFKNKKNCQSQNIMLNFNEYKVTINILYK